MQRRDNRQPKPAQPISVSVTCARRRLIEVHKGAVTQLAVSVLKVRAAHFKTGRERLVRRRMQIVSRANLTLVARCAR